jgi:hypothetical protein
MTIRNTIAAIAIAAASFNAFAGHWEDCAEAHEETCQGSGCFNDRNQNVFQACGAPPLATGADKYRILASIAETCAAEGTNDFDLLVKQHAFDNVTTGNLWFVTPEAARAACAGK